MNECYIATGGNESQLNPKSKSKSQMRDNRQSEIGTNRDENQKEGEAVVKSSLESRVDSFRGSIGTIHVGSTEAYWPRMARWP